MTGKPLGTETSKVISRLLWSLHKLDEIARLHDEAFWSVDTLGGPHKSSEGQLTVHFTNAFERNDGKPALEITGVEVYAYAIGPSRSHYFDSIDDALAAVRKWHDDSMRWVREETRGQ